MNEAKQLLETLISLMGFKDFSVSFAEDKGRFCVFINDGPFLARQLPFLVADLNFVFKQIIRNKGLEMVFVDVNNYRKEREDIIVKLARAAAKKCETIKQPVSLPAMNSFERRIVHNELSMHPDVVTQSEGENKERHVVVQPIE